MWPSTELWLSRRQPVVDTGSINMAGSSGQQGNSGDSRQDGHTQVKQDVLLDSQAGTNTLASNAGHCS